MATVLALPDRRRTYTPPAYPSSDPAPTLQRPARAPGDRRLLADPLCCAYGAHSCECVNRPKAVHRELEGRCRLVSYISLLSQPLIRAVPSSRWPRQSFKPRSILANRGGPQMAEGRSRLLTISDPTQHLRYDASFLVTHLRGKEFHNASRHNGPCCQAGLGASLRQYGIGNPAILRTRFPT